MVPGSVRGRSYGSGPHGLGESAWANTVGGAVTSVVDSALGDPPPLPSKIKIETLPGKAVDWWDEQNDLIKMVTTVMGGLLVIRVIRGVL